MLYVKYEYTIQFPYTKNTVINNNFKKKTSHHCLQHFSCNMHYNLLIVQLHPSHVNEKKKNYEPKDKNVNKNQ